MDIILRKMTETDVADVLKLENTCFNSEAWDEISFLYRIGHEETFLCLVACVGDECCGYISTCSQLGEMTIDSLAVAKDYRRLGIATKLIDEATFLCKPLRTVLEVRESNFPARELYRSLGFREMTLRRGYYDNPEEDAVVMERLTL